jgi:hypothetical protein
MSEKAKNFSEIIELIKNEFQNLKGEDEVQNLWFRAEKKFIPIIDKSKSALTADCYTPLLPNAYRTYGRVERNDYNEVFNNAKAMEPNFKAEFSRKSIMFINQNNIEKNEWDNYFLIIIEKSECVKL